MLLLWAALGRPTGTEESFALGIPEPMPEVDAEMAAAFQGVVATLRKVGLALRSVDISEMLAKLVGAQRIVASYEGARVHQQRLEEYGDRLGQLAVMVREGLQTSDTQYEEAKRLIYENRLRMTEIYRQAPVILVPAATGPAPFGLSYTGDARMNAPWTALGTPAISLPMPVGDALPLGLQLTAPSGEDARVLRTAVRLHQVLYGN
jgi:Asp-tRNA(Asn)/Glu-tRNA(Gln) amidotransferase A subunit family amidase